MFQIQTLNKISPLGTDLLDRNRYRFGDEIENPDAILVRSASMHEMARPASLKAIARAGAGVNNIPLEDCAKEGIVVFNTPGANANAVKELVLLGLLISSRKIVPAMEWVNTLKDEGDNVLKVVEKGKSNYVGPEIKGKTLGVVGLGAIGILVANAAAELGMKVLGYDPYLSVDAAWGLSHKVQHATTLKEIYENSDYITLHVPYNNETKDMINSSSIAMMKNGVRILNLARGELVNDDDLLPALAERKVAVYVTDFPSAKVLGQYGVIAFPHLGASTPESEDNCAKMAVEEIMTYLETGNIVNSVNMPNASMPKSGVSRLCVIHRNESGVISKVSGILSEAGINIENMINASRGEFAYSMLDAVVPISEELAKKVEEIPEVIRTRLI